MNVRAVLLSYLPRFALAIVTVPLAFLLSAFAATHIGVQATRAGALAGAVTFALIILAPSSRNAAVRAGLVCALTAMVAGIAFVCR